MLTANAGSSTFYAATQKGRGVVSIMNAYVCVLTEIVSEMQLTFDFPLNVTTISLCRKQQCDGYCQTLCRIWEDYAILT